METLERQATSLNACHVRMARSGLDLTVRELAAAANMNKATIVRIEAGYPVREATVTAVRTALESLGARFVICNSANDVLVGIEGDPQSSGVSG